VSAASWILITVATSWVAAGNRNDVNRAEKLAAAHQCGPALFSWLSARRTQGHVRPGPHVKACLALFRPIKQHLPPVRLSVWPPLRQEQWIRIPEGTFLMGSNDEEKTRAALHEPGQQASFWHEPPLHQQPLSDFFIARTEVTHAQWAACVQAGRCPTRSGRPTLPVVSVTWSEARAYCHWVGGRLPTEAQWEKAARGPFIPRNIWPWGRRPTCSRRKPNGPGPIAAQACDQSVYGVMDMGGNVAEWVREQKRLSKKGTVVLVKGGSWKSSVASSRIASRRWVVSTTRKNDIGFRCVVTSRTRSL